MTPQELAGAVGGTPVEEIAQLIDLIFDEVEAQHSVAEVMEIRDIMEQAGVNVDGICKRKHPPAP